VLDWSGWNVDADPVTEATTAPGTGGDSTGGLAKAVEMCNNNGHCRKFDAGTMCPSYRVTRDEQHVTRGRANTLRLALSGQLGPDAFTSEAMHETMDLCVGCKGCKRDCPTGVDMAKMKVEFLDHYKKRHGHTLKDRLVAHLPDYARKASRLPWLLNLRNSVPGAAWLGEKLLGFSARRSLPAWRSDTFWRARANEPGLFVERDVALAVARRGGKAAVLFVDTFNGTFESENAFAAARVLQAAGYVLHTVEKRGGHHCCGRTFLASGMVDEAKKKAEALIDALLPLARAGVPIVGLEPSCLLTLRDETLVMGFGEKAELVARQALLFEEFIAREIKQGPLRDRAQARRGADPGARPLPPEGLRRGEPGDGGAQAHSRRAARTDRKLVLRHGRQLRLRGQPLRGVDADGRGQPAAGHPQAARRHRGGRRHQLPPPDRRRRAARGGACGGAAGAAPAARGRRGRRGLNRADGAGGAGGTIRRAAAK
jgi:Fe-S oxidoreductase